MTDWLPWPTRATPAEDDDPADTAKAIVRFNFDILVHAWWLRAHIDAFPQHADAYAAIPDDPHGALDFIADRIITSLIGAGWTPPRPPADLVLLRQERAAQ